MQLRASQTEDPEISLTSLIDVVFLLLIFFMVSTTFEHQAVLKVDLPEAKNVSAPRTSPIVSNWSLMPMVSFISMTGNWLMEHVPQLRRRLLRRRVRSAIFL